MHRSNFPNSIPVERDSLSGLGLFWDVVEMPPLSLHLGLLSQALLHPVPSLRRPLENHTEKTRREKEGRQSCQ